MTRSESGNGPADLEQRLGYTFRDRELFLQALTHSSSTVVPLSDNERMEFLGDSVISIVVSEYLFRSFPVTDEGRMTQMRSPAVSTLTLARRATALGLDRAAFMGKGISANGAPPPSVRANLFEGLVAARYLDGGYAAAREFVLEQLAGEIEDAARGEGEQNYKSFLQQYSQARFGTPPQYRVVRESGPNHARVFDVAAVVGGRRFPAERGRSKKEAEQEAARAALEKLGRRRNARAR